MKLIKNKAGFTIIELIIAIAMFAMIVGVVFAIYDLFGNNYKRGIAIAECQSSARRGINHIIENLRQWPYQDKLQNVAADGQNRIDLIDNTGTIADYYDVEQNSDKTYSLYYNKKDGVNYDKTEIAKYISGVSGLTVATDSQPENDILVTTITVTVLTQQNIIGLGVFPKEPYALSDSYRIRVELPLPSPSPSP